MQGVTVFVSTGSITELTPVAHTSVDPARRAVWSTLRTLVQLALEAEMTPAALSGALLEWCGRHWKYWANDRETPVIQKDNGYPYHYRSRRTAVTPITTDPEGRSCMV